MTESPTEVLARLQESYDRVTQSPITGDASLDVFLMLLSEGVRRWALDLSIPHWFNVELASALARSPDEDAAVLEPRVRQLPFVRPHPRGLAYHDAARDRMRRYLLTREPARVREVCRRLTDALEHLPADEGSQEEISRERTYLRLAHDEPGGLAELISAFDSARQGMRRAACDQLLKLAEEQDALLTETTRNHLNLLQAKLAFDLHQSESARAILARLPDDLSEDLAQQAVLLQGRILEADSRWVDAETHYRRALDQVEAGGSTDALYVPKLYHRRGAANLGLKDLKAAENYARLSLDLNTKSQDAFGIGLNLSLLGEIHGRLGDWRGATAYFERSLQKLDTVKSQADRLVVLTKLARLYQDRRDFAQAEKYYRTAIEERTAAGDTYGLGLLYSDLGWMEVQRGRLDQALADWERSCKAFRTMREPTRVALVMNLIARSLAGLGKPTEAITQQQEALRVLPEGSDLRPAFESELQYLIQEQTDASSWWRRTGRRWTLACFVVAILTVFVGSLILG